ncbi:unnamed protein product [Symbiodinium necroappetens]|uniref:Uncharacterized protein n=1 Tax=Symbiodinium necroappetens TaxID=1628268 RepID=A0A812INR3_9DINO|nr:unnamed protein product [Symbiodinium necroappetens]
MWTLLLVLLAPPSLGMRDWGGAAITRLTAHLRGAFSDDDTNMHELGTLHGLEDLENLRAGVASALSSPYSIVNFSTPAWEIPMDMSEDPPYADAFRKLNSSYAQYGATQNSIYISSNSGKFMDGVRTLEQTDGSSEHAALGFGGTRVSAAEMQDNAATKHLVVQASYPGGPGYFGHAIDNVFPRVLSVFPGAKSAGYKLSVVVPKTSREFFSHNTQVLFEQMGVEVLEEIPKTPHRMAGVTNVASWDRLVRHNTRNVIRDELFRGLTPAACSGGTEDGASQGGWSKVFLSRRSGTRNGRSVEGEELLEAKLLLGRDLSKEALHIDVLLGWLRRNSAVVTPSSFEKVLTCETAQNLLRRFAVLFGACAALGDASDCLDMSSNPEYDDSYESKLMSSDSFIQRCCKESGLPPGWSKTRRITTAVSGESDTLGQAAHADATLYVQHAKEYNPTGLYADYWEWAHALNMSCPDCIVVLCYVHTVPEKLTSLPSSLRSTCESKRSRYRKALLRA